MTWNIRYFYIDTGAAGLTWNGSSLSIPAGGTYAIAGEVGGAEFEGLVNDSGALYVQYGVTTLTGSGGGAETILGQSFHANPTLLTDGSGSNHATTLFLLSDGNIAVVQLFPNNALAGILPDSIVFSDALSLTNASYGIFTPFLYTGSFGGAAGLTCFVAGTLIATLAGAVPVENLRPGDLVLTRDRGFRPVRWAGRQAVSAARLATAERLRPVRIAAGALGPGVPARELRVSPQHRMLLTGPEIAARFGTLEVLAAAKHLVGWPGIAGAGSEGPVSYHHLLFDRHEVLLAEGTWSESLYTGPMAMKMLPAGHRAEILTLFPDLARGAPAHAAPARRFLTGWEVRALRGGLAPVAMGA